jgi:uncharacterized protein YjbJ (UPF0337 family)
MSQEHIKNKKSPMVPNQPKANGNKIAPITEQQKASWEQVKMAAKASWGSLNDEDFKKAGGSMDKLCGVIHDRFGDSPESIKAVLETKMLNKPVTDKKPMSAA